MTDRDQQIRAMAYRLWEEAGRPEGQEDAHWREACRIIDDEDAAERQTPLGEKGRAEATSHAPATD